MRASFVISEVLTGLRRNLTMTVAMILTTMISLALLGSGLLVVRMIDKTEDIYKDRLGVNIWLTNDISANDKGCSNDPCRGLRSELDGDPAVESVGYESRDQAYEKFKRLFEAQPELVKLARPEALPASFHVKLKNPDRPDVIVQAYTGKAGVDSVTNERQYLDRFFDLMNGGRNLTFIVAAILAAATLLLISNTVQVSAFTRRTEVGIMRLVGATRWYTQLPFLLEAVTAGVIGAVLAVGFLFIIAGFLKDALSGAIDASVIGSIENLDVLLISPVLVLIAVVISAITGYFTLRLYVRT